MKSGTTGAARLLAALDRSVQRVAFVADQLSALICAVLIVTMTFAMIIFQLNISFDWMDDLLRTLLIWFVYLGAIPLALTNDHISMDAVYQRLPARARAVVDGLVALIGIGLSCFIAKIGFDSMMQQIAYGAVLQGGQIPAWIMYLALPVGFGLMALAFISYFILVLTGRRHRITPSEAEHPIENL